MALRNPPQDRARFLDLALDLGRGSLGADPDGARSEFITLIEKAQELNNLAPDDEGHRTPERRGIH